MRKNYKRGLRKECQGCNERVNTAENISYSHVSVVPLYVFREAPMALNELSDSFEAVHPEYECGCVFPFLL